MQHSLSFFCGVSDTVPQQVDKIYLMVQDLCASTYYLLTTYIQTNCQNMTENKWKDDNKNDLGQKVVY